MSLKAVTVIIVGGAVVFPFLGTVVVPPPKAVPSIIEAVRSERSPKVEGVSMSKFEEAIWFVETGCVEGPICGDRGLSRGPLQISRAAWKDAQEFDATIGGKYEDVDKIEYSLKVFRAYLLRYASPRNRAELEDTTKFEQYEKSARIWNGGPRGHLKKDTLQYWSRVKAAMLM